MEVVRGGPPPIISEGRNLPQQTIYHWKGNLMASRIHFKYWKNILISRLMNKFREMTLQWLQKKFQTFKIWTYYCAEARRAEALLVEYRGKIFKWNYRTLTFWLRKITGFSSFGWTEYRLLSCSWVLQLDLVKQVFTANQCSAEEGRELKRGWLSSHSSCISLSQEDGDERGRTLNYCDSTNQRNIWTDTSRNQYNYPRS